MSENEKRPLSLLNAIWNGFISIADGLTLIFETSHDYEERISKRRAELHDRLSKINKAEKGAICEEDDLDTVLETDFRKRKKLGPRAKKFGHLGPNSGPYQDYLSLRGDFGRAVSRLEKEHKIKRKRK